MSFVSHTLSPAFRHFCKSYRPESIRNSIFNTVMPQNLNPCTHLPTSSFRDLPTGKASVLPSAQLLPGNAGHLHLCQTPGQAARSALPDRQREIKFLPWESWCQLWGCPACGIMKTVWCPVSCVPGVFTKSYSISFPLFLHWKWGVR